MGSERSDPRILGVVHVRRSLAWLAQSSDTAGSAVRGDRDVRIDFLRGLFVVAMVIDHVAGASWLYLITGGNRFYASAAEGFVFVSGLVAGLTYHRLIARDGLGPVLGRILERAVQLYVLCIGLTLAFIPLSNTWICLGRRMSTCAGPGAVRGERADTPPHVLHGRRTAPVRTPAAGLARRRGSSRAGPEPCCAGVVLATVADLSALSSAGRRSVGNRRQQCVQLRGLAGAFFHWPRDRVSPGPAERGPEVAPKAGSAWAVFTGNESADRRVRMQNAVLGALVHGGPDPGRAQEALLVSLVGKTDLRAGRVFAFACVFSVLYLLVTAWWPTLRRMAGWLFVPLGQHALYAYSLHVALAVIVALALRAVGPGRLGPGACKRRYATGERAADLGGRAVQTWANLVRGTQVGGWPHLLQLPRVFCWCFRSLHRLQSRAGPARLRRALSDTALVARAYGTAVPSTEEPEVVAGTLAQPRAQPDGEAPGSAIHPPASGVGVLNGTLWEPEFYSVALNGEERYFVYLPPEYREAGRRYPVLYLLHGAGGDKSEWVNYGLIQAADRGMSTGALPSMVIVLPQGDLGYWVNHANDGPAWGDYLVNDVVRHIDSTYRTLPDRDHRAIGGLSMGGWGALHAAFARPDVFSVVGAHAPSLRADEGSLAFLGTDRAFALRRSRGDGHCRPRSRRSGGLVGCQRSRPVGATGIGSQAAPGSSGDRQHVRIFPGDHGGAYWHDHLTEYLDFYGQALSQPGH